MPQRRTEAPASTAAKRCVIYCRKSSSEGLDRNYTSIDAQRDTCLRFIESHAGDGWQYTGQVFEDGGFSGGTTDRPAFQRMMRDVRNGEIDIIVIHKLDRINVDEPKAEAIRFIFERYPVIKSAKQVAKELNDRFGPKEPGTPWLTRHVYKILQNIAYKGLVAYEGVEYKGTHAPLVTSEQWALARKVAAENTADREASQRMQSIAEFRGILECGHCNCQMTPGYTMKEGRRYIYYRCVKDYARAVPTCPVRVISSKELERPVWNELGKMLTTPTFHKMLAELKPELKDATEDTLGNLADFIEQLYPVERSRIVHALVREMRLSEDGLGIFFNTNGAKQIAEEMRNHA